MKTQLEKVSNLGRKLNVEVPATVVTETMNRFYQGVQKRTELKGFRKGKAPITMIKSMYGDRIKADVTEELLKMGFSKGLHEHKVEPIDAPKFEFNEVVDGQDFTFSADFEIRPEVELKMYEGLEIEKEVFTVEASEIEKILQNIQNSHSTSEDVTEARPAKLNDIAIIDFKGMIDGAPLDRGDGTDHPLELGSKSFIEGFEEGIVGMTVGQQKVLKLKFPENYAQELANKDVEFEITLKALKTKVLPELNDEFVKKISGGEGTFEGLKENISQDLERRQAKKTETRLKDKLLEKLILLNPVEVPQSLVERQKELLINDTKKQMANEGMDDESYTEYVKKWDSEFEKTAKQMIQVAYLVDAIAQKHELHCTREDVDTRFNEYAAQSGITLKKIREHYSSEESMSRLFQKISEEKVIAYLISKSNIKEVASKG